MSEFNCTRCGWCCLSLNINVSYHDILRWAKEGHYDILAKISYIDHEDKNKRGFYIEDTVTAPKKSCPFLTEDTTCSIYETRPLACKNFPIAYTDANRLKIECPALPESEIDPQESHELRKAQALDFIIADDRKEQLLQILADARLLVEAQKAKERIKEFGDDPTEDLYATGFTNNRTGWTREGSSPWLDSQNQPTAYVWTATKKAEIGDWSFANTARPYTDTLNSVALYIYGYTSSGVKRNTFYLHDGTSWQAAGLPTLGTGYGWVSVDVSTILNTWAKVDGAQMYIEHANSTDQTNVDAAYLLIDYTAAAISINRSDSAAIGESAIILPLVLPNLYESDSVVVTEVAPTVVLSDPQITEDTGLESIVFGETATVAPLILPDINISESTITVGDTPTVQVEGGEVPDRDINVSDSTAVGDTATIDPLELVGIVKSDGIAVGESVVVASEDLVVSESDGVTLGEDSNMTLVLNIQESDSVAVVDILRYYPEQVIVNDRAIVEVEAAAGDRNINVSDGIALGDIAATTVSDPQVSENDGVSTGDTVSIEPLLIDLQASDGTVIGESASTQISDLQVLESDSTTIGETVAIDPITLGDIAELDSVLVEENVNAGVSDPQISPSPDNAAVGDSATIYIGIEISETDAATIAESTTAAVSDPQILESDNVAVAEAPTVQQEVSGVIYINVSDGAAVGDTATVSTSDPQVSQSDSTTAGDTATVDIQIDLSASDNAAVGDTATLEPLLINISNSDAIVVGESSDIQVPIIGELYINVSDGVDAADTALVSPLLIDISKTDNTIVADTATPDLTVDVYASDSTVIGDTVSLEPLELNTSVLDNVVVAEQQTVIVPVVGELYINVSDSTVPSDLATIAPLTLPNVFVSDSAVAGDTASVELTIYIFESDSVVVGDIPDTSVSDPQIIKSDGTTVADNVNVSTSVVGELYVNVSDGVITSDTAIAATGDPEISVSDTAAAADSAAVGAIGIGISVSEIVATGESVTTRGGDMSVSVSDGAAVGDAAQTNVTISILKQDGVVVVEAPVVASEDLDISAADTIAVTEDYSFNLYTYSYAGTVEIEDVSIYAVSLSESKPYNVIGSDAGVYDLVISDDLVD